MLEKRFDAKVKDADIFNEDSGIVVGSEVRVGGRHMIAEMLGYGPTLEVEHKDGEGPSQAVSLMIVHQILDIDNDDGNPHQFIAYVCETQEDVRKVVEAVKKGHEGNVYWSEGQPADDYMVPESKLPARVGLCWDALAFYENEDLDGKVFKEVKSVKELDE